MKLMTTQWLNRVGALSVIVGLSAAAVEAQSVSGEAFGTFVQTPFASQGKTPVATLPSVSAGNGEMAEASADNNSVPGAVSTDLLTSVTSGALGASKAGAQSVATVADVGVLDGLITATRVFAVVSSTRSGSTATSDANGSTFDGLVVNGIPFGENVAPNTRVDLPGVGYVVLNEQSRSGDGISSSGITVNMIHVVLQDALTGFKTGEIIVGSASSQVQ